MAEWDEIAAEKAATDAEDALTSDQVGEGGITTFEELCQWWYKYYLATGHKRLGRMLISAGKDMRLFEGIEQVKQSDYQ